MNQKPDLLCQYYGGSHSYGLNTPSSDIDYRGVYALNDVKHIIDPNSHGTSSLETLVTTLDSPEKTDSAYFEFRHFLHLLRKGNTGSIEMLFNMKWKQITNLFQVVILNRRNLLDPTQLHRSVQGYSASEYNLAIGARTGKLGGKRQEAVAKYGFSPKNFVNLFRLLYSADQFFACGEFPVDLTGSYIYPRLMEIKVHPERFTKARLEEMYQGHLQDFELSWHNNSDKICKEYRYDNNVATDLILRCYLNQLDKAGMSKLRYFVSRLVP